MMKLSFSAVLLLVASSIPAFAIRVSAPADGAQLSSPFRLVASTAACGGFPAVSMGYSIDNGPDTFEPTSFTDNVVASRGPHILKVKCWGKHTTGQVNLNIMVRSSDIAIKSPANGAKVTSPFTLGGSGNCLRRRTCPVHDVFRGRGGGLDHRTICVQRVHIAECWGTHVLTGGLLWTKRTRPSLFKIPPGWIVINFSRCHTSIFRSIRHLHEQAVCRAI